MACIQLDKQDRIATVTLNRPERLNALDLSAWRELDRVLSALGGSGDIGCVVFRGAGERAFCAGHDLSRFDDERNTPDRVKSFSTAVKSAMDTIRGCPHPTVAAIHGYCMGAGVQLATNCDFRLAADSARVSLTPSKIGLFLEYELLDALVSLVGRAAAMEIVLEGQIYEGEDARAISLVDRVVPASDLDQEARTLAASLARTGKNTELVGLLRRPDI